jgi:cytochrome c oxidase subunit 2
VTDFVLFGVLWVGLSALGEWGLHLLFWHHDPWYFMISRQGAIGLDAFKFLSIWLLPIWILVVLFVVYGLLRFRAPDDRPLASRSQTMHHRGFITFWVGGSILVNLLFWIHPTVVGLEQLMNGMRPSANRHDLVVDVTARQWEWIFSYPQYHITQAVNRRGFDLLEIPVNRKVQFVLRSYDPFHTYDVNAAVIHSFWVPAFGLKEDIIPGETRYEYITATRTATYATNPMVRVQCAEVCGPGHPWMEAPINIVTARQFQAWVHQEQAMASAT